MVRLCSGNCSLLLGVPLLADRPMKKFALPVLHVLTAPFRRAEFARCRVWSVSPFSDNPERLLIDLTVNDHWNLRVLLFRP